MEFVDSLIGGGAAGLTVGGITLTVIKTWLNNLVQKNKELENKVSDLENRRINNLEKTLDAHLDKLEETVEKHIRDDKSQETLTEIKHISGYVSKLVDRQEIYSSDLAEVKTKAASLESKQEADHLFITNINTALQKHKDLPHAK